MTGRSSFLQRLFRRPAKQAPVSSHDDSQERILHKLDALDSQLTTLLQRASSALPTPEQHVDNELGGRLDALQQGLAAIEKQLQRAGREQLKANALVEAQQEQARTALEALEAAGARREEALGGIGKQIASAQENARLDLIRQFLPALDGLDEALRAGEEILGKPVAEQRQLTLFERMRSRTTVLTPEEERLRGALQGWLHGLTFVRERLLKVLEGEDVRPIEALHAPFDPMLHIALQALPATPETPPGSVVAVLRGGYTVGERVLRHAEVAVAQEWERSVPET